MHMGSVLAIVNQKGGVGKTTTAVNLAASLALAEKEILVIDSDPQGNATTGLGIRRDDLTVSIYNIFTSETLIDDVVVDTAVEHLRLIPSTVDLLAAEVELVEKPDRERILRDAVTQLRRRFEYILIDCPPSLGLLTLNALVAADGLIVPVQCEYYALEGLSMLTRTITMVKNAFNPDLAIRGILLTMFDSRNSLSRQVAEEVRRFFGSAVFSTVVPRNVTLGEAPSHGKPAMLYDFRSRGAQSYLELAKEILYENGTGQRT